MHVYLYLYPIVEYFLDTLLRNQQTIPGSEPVQRLNSLIDARFRSQGVQICWLFHSSAEDWIKPDLTRRSPSIRIEPPDRLLAAGVTFEMMHHLRLHAENDFILSQLPPETTRLTIGGFHKNWCVRTLAIEALSQGLAARVDEATTEDFFRN